MQLIRVRLTVQIVLDLINDNIGTRCIHCGKSEGKTAHKWNSKVGQHWMMSAKMWSATAVCDEEDSTDGYGVQRCD